MLIANMRAALGGSVDPNQSGTPARVVGMGRIECSIPSTQGRIHAHAADFCRSLIIVDRLM